MPLKSFAEARAKLTLRHREFHIEVVTDPAEIHAIHGELAYAIVNVFQSHFDADSPEYPDATQVVESKPFRESIQSSDAIIIARTTDEVLAYDTLDLALFDERIVLTKGTYARKGFDTQYGLGNLLNYTALLACAELWWSEKPNVPVHCLGRTHGHGQIIQAARHSDRTICSSDPHLSRGERQAFARFAEVYYPSTTYDAASGIFRDVYKGVGHGPDSSTHAHALELEFLNVGPDDGVFFLNSWDSAQSHKFQRTRHLIAETMGDDLAVVKDALQKAAKMLAS